MNDILKCNLIVLIKNPKLGHVKTRLAKDIGDEKALKIYHKLLAHTLKIAASTDCKVHVFFSQYIDDQLPHLKDDFNLYIQIGDSLGERIIHAFRTVFDQSTTPTIIIGSDCHEMNSDTIHEACIALRDSDIAIGPANDGGYYLLGMNTFNPVVFDNMIWSTSQVFDQTIENCNKYQLTYSVLKELIDIDTLSDLRSSDLYNLI